MVHDQLVELLPRTQWTQVSHLLQAHGRRTCRARKPACPVCPVRDLCPWSEKTP
jgi:endonuclease-3